MGEQAPDRERLTRLLEQLRGLAPAEQAARVAALRIGDPALADELSRLLKSHDDAGGLDTVRADSAPSPPSSEPSQRTLPTGTRLGHFRIEQPLGKGGMGVVYRAHDEKLGRAVAVKVMLENDPRQRSRFLREAQLAAAVSHPNIAAVHEVGEVEGNVFIAMELVEGESLRQRLASPLSLDEALGIARQIAQALERAHQKGIVHRDLKPENVMVGPGQQVKILDFGLAKQPEERAAVASFATEQGMLIGTPGYMSPEQTLGRAVDHRTDLFSLGVILYEMVSGRRPFVGSSMEMVLAATRDEPPPLASVKPDVPEALERLIARMMAKDPAQRPDGARAVLAELEALNRPGAREPRRSPVAPREPSRARARVALVAATAVVLAAGVMAWRARAPRVTLVTDLTLPAWAKPASQAAYHAGLQLERDGSDADLIDLYRQVAASEPQLAHPWLRMAISSTRGQPARAREYYEHASALRSTLSPRDQALLDAIAPCVRSEVQENAECARRLDEAARRFAGDAELQALAGEFHFNAGALDEAIVWMKRATERDPGYAAAWIDLGWVHAYLGQRADAMAELQRCVDTAQNPFPCFSYRSELYAEEGRCDAMAADAHRAVAMAPSLPAAWQLLADAYAGEGRSTATVREALRQKLAHTPEAERAAADHVSAMRLAVLDGDFAEAERQARSYEKAVADSTSEEDHAVAARFLVEVYRETGRVREAATVAGDFEGRRAAWIPDRRGDDFSIMRDPTPLFVSVEAEAGTRSAAQREVAMAAWLGRWRSVVVPFYANYLWIHGWAVASTPEEARAALGELPNFSPIPGFRPQTLTAADVGRTLLLGGRAAEAQPELDRAVRHCFRAQHPFEWVRALYFRGRAREERGDHAGACADYAALLLRWREPSRTAADASRRSQALGCSQ